MKNIKSLAAAMLVLCMVLSLCACGGAENTAQTTEPAAPQQTTPVTEVIEQVQTEPPADDGMVTYTVTVVDEEGNAIPGAMVQICMDTCYPGVTNESGTAQFSVPEADYKVSFLSLPAGYTYSSDEQDFHFEAGSTDITITLKTEG